MGRTQLEPEWDMLIRVFLEKGSAGLICIDTVDGAGSGRMVTEGERAKRELATAEVLEQEQKRERTGPVWRVRRAGKDWLVLVGLEEKQLEQAAVSLEEVTAGLRERLEDRLGRDSGGLPVFIGCSLLVPVSGLSSESLMYAAWKRAILGMPAPLPRQISSDECLLFEQILEAKSITSVYQPIVSLADGTVLGYEALTRGPADSAFHSPLSLFGYAESCGQLYELDRMAREKAIEGCASLPKDQRVFINIPAQVIHDPQFSPGMTRQALKRWGLEPRNVVLELTERSSIEDFATARQVLQHYRNQGYQIAIDDAGAGYSSLQAIAELQPDFIKVDRSLIQNIHLDKMKETILETFVSFARKMSIRLIAEGIESWEELNKLSRMGVHYGQGFLLCRPAPGLSVLPEDIAARVRRISRVQDMEETMQIGSLAAPMAAFDLQTASSEVAQFFRSNEDVSGVAITRGNYPVGLVMRERLFQQLAGQYGVPLYWNRPICQIMDTTPLIVESTVHIEDVSRMSMSREKNRLYDLIIITENGKMAGAASVQVILEAITRLRMESAKVANPLTGLPGNLQIKRELNRCIHGAAPFIVIYADLDYFKWFNDRFGFQKGDQLIQFTADVLQQSVSACGFPHDFVGHIGGDDFIVISFIDEPDRLCEEMLRRFRQASSLFDEEVEREEVLDRSGRPVNSSGVHLSLSAVVCPGSGSVTLEGISHEAAVLKKQAKEQLGSVWVRSSM